jgi:phenylacetate-CoA ligase
MSFLQTLSRTAWTIGQFGPSRRSPLAIQRRQDRRLRRLLKFAFERSPFYHDRFRGIDLEAVNLAELPTTTKAEVMANFDRVVTDPSIRRAALEDFLDDPANVGKLFGGRPVCHTSGSQGQPLIIVHDWRSLDLLFAFQMTRGNVGYIRRGMMEFVKRLFSPARLAVVINRPGFFPSAVVWKHRPQSMGRFLKLLEVMGNDPDLVSKLNAFRPTALTATPTTLDLLATRADKPSLPDLEETVANSEMLSRNARDRIAAAFGVPVLDNYANGECLFLTNGCVTHPGAHVNADWAVLEVVDADNRPVPDGTLGAKAFLTNLANYTQPLIRYEVGDLLAYATETCECGSRLPRLGRIVGRSADVFKISVDGQERVLPAYPFQHAFEHFRAIREWQAVDRGDNRILVRFEPIAGEVLDFASIKERLDERLGFAGFANALSIDFETVDRLDIDQRTGKFKRMIVRSAASSKDPQPGTQRNADELMQAARSRK